MWKVVTSYNLNPLLKLFFYLPILTNNNLLLKIYCENIVIVFFNYDFFLYYFSSFHFIFIHSHFISFFLFSFFFFSFSCFSPPHKCPAPFFYFLFHRKNIPTTHLLHIREREREGYSSTAPPPVEIEVAERTKPVEIGIHHAALPRLLPHHRSSSPPPSWVRSAFFFFLFFFFFSYLLVLIQIYFKNWILFCVWIM